jgi:hypothetical protein
MTVESQNSDITKICLKCKLPSSIDVSNCENCGLNITHYYTITGDNAMQDPMFQKIQETLVVLFVDNYSTNPLFFDTEEEPQKLWLGLNQAFKDYNLSRIKELSEKLLKIFEMKCPGFNRLNLPSDFVSFLNSYTPCIEPSDDSERPDSIEDYTPDVSKMKAYESIFIESDSTSTTIPNQDFSGVTSVNTSQLLQEEPEQISSTASALGLQLKPELQKETEEETLIRLEFNIITNNAFRILELYSFTTAEEVTQARLTLESNSSRKELTIPPLLETIQHTANVINQAVKELEAPENRILHRIFWFSEENLQLHNLTIDSYDYYITEFENSISNAGAHDAALVHLIFAFRTDPLFENSTLWNQVIDSWHRFYKSPGYWAYLNEYEKKANFKVQATNVHTAQAKVKALELIFNSMLNLSIKTTSTDTDVSRRLLDLLNYAYSIELIDYEMLYMITNQVLNNLETKIETTSDNILKVLKSLSKPDPEDDTIIKQIKVDVATLEEDIIMVFYPIIIESSQNYCRDCTAVKEKVAETLMVVAEFYRKMKKKEKAITKARQAYDLTANPDQKEKLIKLLNKLGEDTTILEGIQSPDLTSLYLPANKTETNKKEKFQSDEYVRELCKVATSWNWGAFAFTWIWGIFNYTYKPLKIFLGFLAFNVAVTLVFSYLWIVPDVDPQPYFYYLYIIFFVVLMVICGIKGNDWALRSKKWRSLREYENSQKIWAIAGEIFIGISIPTYALVFYDKILPFFQYFWEGFKI